MPMRCFYVIFREGEGKRKRERETANIRYLESYMDKHKYDLHAIWVIICANPVPFCLD